MHENDKDRIGHIIEAYYKGGLSSEMDEIIQGWMVSDDNPNKDDALACLFFDKVRAAQKPDSNTEKSLKETQERLKFPGKKSISLRRRIWQATASAAAVLLFIGTGYFIFNQVSEKNEQGIIEILALQGDYEPIILPDGSEILLTKGTLLSYEKNFTTNRNVHLNGEAFFKVQRDTINPFKVSTTNMKVNVLGTVFSVHESTESTTGIVSLFDGRVSVETDGSVTTLSRGERLKYSAASKETEIVIIPASEMISKGYQPRLKFEHATFGEVVEALSAFYEVEISTPGIDLSAGDLTVTLDDESLNEALDILIRMANKNMVKYTIDNGVVTIL